MLLALDFPSSENLEWYPDYQTIILYRAKEIEESAKKSVDWTFDEDCDCKPMWKFAVKYDAFELRYELRDYETQSESRSIPFATKVAKLEFLITFRIWTVKAACNFLAGSGFFFIWKINKCLLLIELLLINKLK